MIAPRIGMIAVGTMAAAVLFSPVASAAEAYTGASVAGEPGAAAVFTHRLQAEGTNLCLDAPRPGGELTLAACAPGAAQQWRWTAPAQRTNLRHEASTRCAERIPGGATTRVRSAGCSSNPAQGWNVLHRTGHVVIKGDNNQCLARDLRGVAMRPCADTPAQRWKPV